MNDEPIQINVHAITEPPDPPDIQHMSYQEMSADLTLLPELAIDTIGYVGTPPKHQKQPCKATLTNAKMCSKALTDTNADKLRC